MRSLTKDLAVPRMKYFRKTTDNAGETAGYRIRTDWEGCCRPKGLRVECRKVEVFRISLTTRFGCTSGDFVRLALSESRDSRSPHPDYVINPITIRLSALSSTPFKCSHVCCSLEQFVEDGLVKKTHESKSPATTSPSPFPGPAITQCL